jgi:hypothetical protein
MIMVLVTITMLYLMITTTQTPPPIRTIAQPNLHILAEIKQNFLGEKAKCTVISLMLMMSCGTSLKMG